jgi:hypothetical protein
MLILFSYSWLVFIGASLRRCKRFHTQYYMLCVVGVNLPKAVVRTVASAGQP